MEADNQTLPFIIRFLKKDVSYIYISRRMAHSTVML